MTRTARMLTVGGFVRLLAETYPLAWAEPWDRVGLLAGDPIRPLRRVMVSLDADGGAVARAVEAGCDLLLTHHPAALDVDLPLTTDGPARVLVEALASGVALAAFHTNLDRSPDGGDALPRALGLEIVGPLESGFAHVATVTTFVPVDSESVVRSAMNDAGAGRIGLYEACTFSGRGTGRFMARPEAHPVVGEAGESASDESRLEAVCGPQEVSRVVAAIRSAHPYEEPVILVTESSLSRGAARLGRLCHTAGTETLASLAQRSAQALGVCVRVWGERTRGVHTVAVGNGSAGSLISAALAAGADVLLAGEVRYHDARAALDAGLAIIEAGHDATEWPLVAVLAHSARMVCGSDAEVIEETPTIPWWTTERP